MSGYDKLFIMYQELTLKLVNHIVAAEINSIIHELKITFRSRIILYIRYNDFDEYGYHLMYSNKRGDYVRFDNHDKNWNVSSSPHHFHLRYKKGVEASLMNGSPNNDAPYLIDFLIDLL